MMGSVPKDLGFGLVNVPNDVYFHIHNKKCILLLPRSEEETILCVHANHRLIVV